MPFYSPVNCSALTSLRDSVCASVIYLTHLLDPDAQTSFPPSPTHLPTLFLSHTLAHIIMASPAPVPTSPQTKINSAEPTKAPTSAPDAAEPSAAVPKASVSSPAPAAARSSAAAPAAEKDATASTPEADAEEDIGPIPTDPEGIINMEIFSQIQDMDDDDDDEAGGHEFSKGIVWGYFEQAESTFQQMEDAIGEPSLWKLSSLGHFLKGSSAALGIINVQNSCEKMQHYGNLRDEEVGAALSEDEALRRIRNLLVDCKRDYAVASAYLRQLYASYDE
ncbi:hypothetical protein CcaverHIS002_0602900 [Cutaneotrichosporon cavernicola]|nr:hypothetical protein CcaverHIS002_0602900 [Cutaneotrichosporon cavernicola]